MENDGDLFSLQAHKDKVDGHFMASSNTSSKDYYTQYVNCEQISPAISRSVSFTYTVLFYQSCCFALPNQFYICK